jgi:hypothetical protein
MRLVVSSENQRSTLFIQLALVGVKRGAGMAAPPSLHLGVFGGGLVVQHQVDQAAGVAARHQPQKAQEFLYVLDPDDPFPEG